jgi:hypothetical protein
MKTMTSCILASLLFVGCGSAQGDNNIGNASGSGSPSRDTSLPAAATSRRFVAEIWADNWFALYVNGEKVGEDSVPITTERSFNSETIEFTATYPLTLALEVKDYVENDSGLEYIGTDRQQIGDGGVVAQITDVDSGQLVAVTDNSWKAYPIHTAPLNPGCVTSTDPSVDCQSRILPAPAEWAATDFDDTAWSSATTFEASEVGPKEGYNDVVWDSSTRFIWGPDLKADNVVLLRLGAVAASPKL